MKLRFLNGPMQGRIVEIKADGLSVGRDRDCDVVIEDDGISRRHCRILVQGGQLWIEDAGSTNGVRINGRRIAAREEIRRGDHLGLGPFVLQVTDTGDLIDAAALPAADAGASSGNAPRPAPATARAPIPWAQALLLVVLLAAFAGLAYITFFAPPAAPPAVPGVGTSGLPGDEAAMDATAGGTGAVAERWSTERTDEAVVEPPPAVPPAVDTPPPDPALPAPLAPGAGEVLPVIVIASVPAGATLRVNGVERGLTPVFLRDLPPGRHTITLSLDGYESLDRQIHYPSLIPDRPYTLRQKAGTLLIDSQPAGAAVQHGARILGVTPLLVDDLPPGEHEFRLLTMVHEPVRIKGKVSELRPEGVTVTLQSRLGNLEILTYPAGCDVLVNGTLAGRTQAASAETRDARPLLVTGLLEGEYDVLIRHPLGAEDRGKVLVARGETRRVSRRLWVLDTELVLIDGDKRYGMWVERNDMGDVTLAETSKDMKRYLKPQIARINELTPDQSRELLERKRFGGLRSGDRPPLTPPEAALPPGVPERGGPAIVAARPVAEAPAAGAADGEEMPADGAFSVEQLNNLMRASTATRLKQLYRERVLTVTGVPTTYGGDRTNAYVNLGSRLRFEFTREQFDLVKERIGQARDGRQPLSLRGKVADYTATGFIFRECALVDGADGGGE